MPKLLHFPLRASIKGSYLYIHNFKPERWPCGNPETGFRDTGASPTMDAVLNSGETSIYHQLCTGKRPQQELYHLHRDPDCLNNLANHPEHQSRVEAMKHELFSQLKKEGDLWMFGRGEEYEQYPLVKPGYENFYEDVIKGRLPSGRPAHYSSGAK